MVASAHPFVKSTLEVGPNAVKSILFRAAGFLMQVTVLKIFALVASERKAFMPYLMFTEDIIQQLLFIAYNMVKANGWLVLSFVAFFAMARVFDTFLWALDAPGYVARPSSVNARIMLHTLLPEPAYVVSYMGKYGNVTAVDSQLEDLFSSNLFRTGYNVTLTADALGDGPGPEAVASTRNISDTGPRIWLDADGFSVSASTKLAYINASADSSHWRDCSPQPYNATTVMWRCTYDNSDARTALDDPTRLVPELHWGDAAAGEQRPEPSRWVEPVADRNPWAALRRGGATVFQKQLFTIARGRRRHTFLHTAIKATMLLGPYTGAGGSGNAAVARRHVDRLLQTWFDAKQVPYDAQVVAFIARDMLAARAQNRSFSQGSGYVAAAPAAPFTVVQDHVELLTPVVGDRPVLTMVRVSVVNITLVRSETLAAAVQPREPCDRAFMQLAYGGQAYGSDCFDVSYRAPDPRGGRFLGEVDTAAVFVIGGIFDLGGANTSAEALNATAARWLWRNTARIDNLLMARGYLVAVDPGMVTLRVTNVRPAVSFLQLTLVIMAAVAALLSYVAVVILANKHYASSLLANLVATTTDKDQPRRSQRPSYLWRVPDITLAAQGAQTVLVSAAGLYRLDKSTAETSVAQLNPNHQSHPVMLTEQRRT